MKEILTSKFKGMGEVRKGLLSVATVLRVTLRGGQAASGCAGLEVSGAQPGSRWEGLRGAALFLGGRGREVSLSASIKGSWARRRLAGKRWGAGSARSEPLSSWERGEPVTFPGSRGTMGPRRL